MYDIDFIFPLVKDAGDKLKKELPVYPGYWKSDFKDDAYYDSLPELNPIYKETVKQHNKIAVHSTIDLFPYQILRSKAPNQSEAEWNFQMGIYESITNSTWDRAKSKTKIIANTQNYSINWKNEEQKKYFYEDYPAYHSIEAYFMDIVRDRKIDFPNQVLLIKPKEIPGKFVEGKDGLEFKPDQSKLVDPICEIIEEVNIIQFKDNEYFLLLSEEKSTYKKGGVDYDDGLVMEFYDKQNIWKFIQNGVDEKYNPTFDSFLMYEHKWGWLPARKLGGKPKTCKNEIYYHSIFVDAVPVLNTYIRLWSNYIMSQYANSFTRMMIVVDDCDYVSRDNEACNAGQVYDHTKHATVVCPKCGGTGDNIQDSPTGIYKVRMNKGLKDNPMPLTPPIQFAEPNPAILVETREYLKELLESAFSFMSKTKEASNETATGEMLDEQDFQSMLVHFAGEVFDLMDFTIEGMGWLRWQQAFDKPEIKDPTYFNFRTPEGITEEIGQAREKGMPETYIKPLMVEAGNTRLGANNFDVWAFDLQTKIDRLWAKDELEIQAMLGRTCDKVDSILHTSFTYLLNRCIEEAGGFEPFSKQSLDQQTEAITKKAQEIAAKVTPPPIKEPSDALVA